MAFEEILANLESSNPELAEITGRVMSSDSQKVDSPINLQEEELYNQLSTSVNVDTSASSAFIKKFAETKELTESAGDYLTRKFPENTLSSRIMFRNKDGDFTIPYLVSPSEYFGEDFTKLSEDERRVRINNKSAEEIDNYYGSVASSASPIASGLGIISGYLTDPITLTPIGKTYKVAAGIGAAVGGSDIFMEQLAREGKVQATDVALGALLGGVLGPVVKYAGDSFMPWIKSKVSKGEPVSAEEIISQIPKEAVESGDVTLESAQKLSNTLSEKLDLSPKEYLSHSIANTNDLIHKSSRAELRSAEEALFGERIATISQDDISLKNVDKIIRNELDFRSKFGEDGFLTAAEAKIDIDKAVKDALKSKRDKKVKLETPVEAEAKALKEVNFREEKIVNSFREFAKRTGQTGEIAPWLIRDIGLATAGGLAGYASSGGDLESAAMWAIGTGALAHGVGILGPKLYNKVGKMLPYNSQVTDGVAEKWGQKYMSYAWAERPSEYFKNVAGDVGHKFSSLLDRMNEDIRARMSNDLIDIRQSMHGFKISRKSVGEKSVVDVLRNPKKASQYSPEIQQAAKFVRNKLNFIVKDAMGRGVIDQKVGQKMLKDTVEKGYFPRVYDKFFLSSNKGRDKWHEVLGSWHWSKEQIESASKSLLEGKNIDFDRFKPIRDKKTGEIKYTVDNQFIAELYKNNGKATFSNRSTHLEKNRKINLPDEVLEPFLIDDLEDVLSSYFHDTQKRIQAAKYFGANDEGMHDIIKGMKEKGLVKRETDVAWEVFWTSVGDSKSNSIKQMIEMPQWQRNLYSKMTALQTSKLIFAQILNLTQATVNSMIYLPSRVGVKTPKIILRGMSNTFKKQNRGWAERIGAAAESTILEAAGEMGALESRFATKFLKYTGFTLVERIQRQLAANIGKSYAEELLDTKSKLFIKSRKGKLSNSGKAQIKQINKQLLEIGINPDLSPNSIPIDQMNRAGQRFSNTVNFVNTADKMPILLQSPHMKIFRQFKTYMFHQGAFLNDNVLKPAKRGDLRPIIGLAAAGGLGMTPSEIRKWLRADDKDYTMTERYLQGFTAIGGLGLMYDLAQQSANGSGRFASSILGPTASTFSDIVGGVVKTGYSVLEGEPTLSPLGKTALNLPVIGQAFDILGVASQIGKATDIDLLEDLPTKKEVRKELSDKKKNPYSYYSNLYK